MNIVYKITNIINNKIYIGFTSRDLQTRFDEHCVKGFILYNAIKKYGKENFNIETIFEHEDEEIALSKEREYIDVFNCLAPRGYNLTGGGEKSTVSFERRSKAQRGLKKKPLSQKQKDYLSDKNLGKARDFYKDNDMYLITKIKNSYRVMLRRFNKVIIQKQFKTLKEAKTFRDNFIGQI